MTHVLQQINDGLGKLRSLWLGQRSPIRSSEKNDCQRFPAAKGLCTISRWTTGLFRPARVRCKSNSRFMRRRLPHMIEVIPNLHVAAGKLAKIAMEQYYAFVSIIHGRLTSPTGIPSAKILLTLSGGDWQYRDALSP
jgi:hypothetical protein